jgi:hypothetical protein
MLFWNCRAQLIGPGANRPRAASFWRLGAQILALLDHLALNPPGLVFDISIARAVYDACYWLIWLSCLLARPLPLVLIIRTHGS